MVVIRLSRTGAKKRPFFNVVVIDSRARRDGKFIEHIGFYNPKAGQNDERLRMDLSRIAFWINRGAQASGTVKRLMRDFKKNATEPATETVSEVVSETLPEAS